MEKVFGSKIMPKHPERLDLSSKCKTCNEEFKITLEKNIQKEEVLIQIDKKQIEISPGRNFLGLISTSPALAQDKFKYEQVTRYQSVCPNCGDGKELFCSSYPNKKIVEENSEVYAYIPGSICD